MSTIEFVEEDNKKLTSKKNYVLKKNNDLNSNAKVQNNASTLRLIWIKLISVQHMLIGKKKDQGAATTYWGI